MTTEGEKLQEYLKRVTSALHQTRLRLREVEAKDREPIAIVGMSCRYAGGVRTPEALWELLREGRDAIAPLPETRGWNLDELYDPDPDKRGKIYVREGGFLRDADGFDAAFFGISPREALAIDPQQRLLLETSYEAIERAGIEPSSLHGSQTGVFVGILAADYGSRLGDNRGELEGYIGVGSAFSVASGRIAYALGLEGPAITVDTACSSSLVALHLACQALRRGECTLALAGGATVMSTPFTLTEFCRLRGLAVDGRSRAFSADASGFGVAEGVGILALARLEDARRHGYPILALVRGSAVNQDGRSQGLTAPNGPSQQRVIQAALQSAQLSAGDVDAIEAHGTGTTLGDPIEAQALIAAYGRAHSREQPLWLGSIKSNLGHTQAAAGVAGVIKMVLSMQHGLLPRTLHADTPSTHIDWSTGTVQLLNEPIAWPESGRPRRAGVSAFGISGTNAHVLLEQAPAPARAAAEASEGAAAAPAAPLCLLVSGKSEVALRAQAAALGAHIEAHPEQSLSDVAWSLATTRTQFEHRAVVVARERAEVLSALHSLAEGDASPTVALGQARSAGRVVFVFPGQGSQWVGMARSLMETSEVFGREIEACSGALGPHVDWSLKAVLRGEEGSASLERVDVVQPVLFAMMVSLAAVWRSMGIEPEAVVGHSQGEVAAAVVAGALSLEDGAKVVAVRSRLLRRLEGKGAMGAVELSAAELEPHLARYGKRVGIAAYNGPSATLVSGDAEAVEALVSELSGAQIFARKVRVSYASHSTHVDEIQGELLSGLGELHARKAVLPFYSTVEEERLSGDELSAAYWVKNLREPVRFVQTTDKLIRDEHRFFIEVSPHPVLTLALQASLQASIPQGATACSLRNDDGTLGRLLLSVGELFARGLAVDWTKILPAGRRVELPTYAFQRQRYWLEAPKGRATDVASAGLGAANHPLLGAAVTLADADGLLLTGRLSLAEHPWLAGHRVYDTVLLPGTALVEVCLVAAQHVGLNCVEELTLESPLALPPQGALQLQLSVGAPDEARRRAVTIHTRAAEAGPEAPWTRHASGWLCPSVAEARFDMANWPPEGATSLDLAGYYERLAEAGVTYGKDDFQGLVAAWRQGADVLAEVCLPAGLVETAGDYGLHPALFDAALHALALLSGDEMTTSLPFVFGGVGLYATGASRLRVRLSSGGGEGGIQARLADAEGRPVALIEALRTRPVSPTQLRSSVPAARDGLYRVDWPTLAECSAPPLTGAWVLLGEGPRGLTAALEASSVRVCRMADLEELSAALEGGDEAPDLVLVPWVGATGASPAAVHATTHRALSLLQRWVSDERLSSTRLVLLTCRAIAAGAEEDVLDLEHAPLWGLGRTAQSEYGDQPIQLVDVDASEASFGALPSALNAGEPQLALRDGAVRVPRLGRLGAGEVLAIPPGEASYHLDIPTRGSLDGLSFVASSHGSAPLASGEVRIAVRAAGLNFRDVLNALGMYPGDAGPLGAEGAGVITEVGPGVSGLAPGDRVMGMFPRSIGPLAVADARMVIRMPEGWSFAQGAATPAVFLTAYYALVELARLQRGERLLVHAAAGGVGMAAVQLARHLGAEVFGTASAGKWGVLRTQGLEDSHIGSSRTLEFEEHFRRSTQGQGVDVVLNSLAREYVDASLRLLPRGGRFIEMGKTDVREASSIARTHPGVRYRAFELGEAGPERIQQMLRELVTLFERGVLQPLPVQAWDARRARDAFRYLGQARHVGKLVLTLPRALAPEGTVLITGGTGGLGALLAHHLVDTHAVRHLLLTSRQGLAAPGAGALQAELEGKGAQVTIAACDVSDREAVAHLLASVPQDHPLTAVIHGAVVLDDGVLSALDPGRVDRVFLAKVDGAMHLSELTRPLDLSSFVLFSSGAGVFGNAGQGSYAAANVFLDALAAHRRAQGLSGQSLAWGAWGEVGRAARLAEADQARLRRQGVLPLSPQEGLALFDAALGRPEALLAPLRLDFGALRAQTSAPRLLHALVRTSPRRAAAHGRGAASSLKQRLAALPATERDRTLLELVRNQVAPVLGLSHPEALDPARPLQELGLDSLMAVELRNRLGAATDLRLPSTLLFDYPTASALVQKLSAELLPNEGSPRPVAPARQGLPDAAADEPIAIVGMACRYPGGVTTPEALWQVLADGIDAITAFPGDRGWDLDRLYHPDPDTVGTTYAQRVGSVAHPDLFDSDFFGLSPREAVAIDPQHRLLLETSWEAIERAGIAPSSLNESPTGVFVGICSDDYQHLAPSVNVAKDGYAMLGTATSIASGRIAYTLGLQGPAVSVDTACSSSLVGIHLACQALRAGECTLALAGGATIFATPNGLITFSRLKALAPDGRSKAFSAAADGMGWSEGVGMLLLERLSDARRNNRPVLALIRGSAINQDGRSQGLTAPNGPAQERVIQKALESSGLSPADVDAVEAHGTGTALGDPIEAHALFATYGQGHSSERPLWLGSIKSNLGHTQAAAGVAGVMKMVLAMQHGLLPRTLHAETPSSYIDWSKGTVRLLNEPIAWREGGHPRRAGVSSFGISGTNAHVLLEEAPAPERPAGAEQSASARGEWAGPLPVLVSGKSEAALRAQAAELCAHVEAHPEQLLSDVAYSLATARTHFKHRAVVVASEAAALRAALGALGEGKPCAGMAVGQAREGGRLAMLFTGQGSQRPGMGRELYDAYPAFRDALDAVCAQLDGHLDRPLLEVMFSAEGSDEAALLDQTAFTQPALFALEVALYRLWEGWGVKPDVLLGHSIGEIAAAQVSGVLSLGDACTLVAARGRLMQALPRGGAMIAVQASEEEARGLLNGHAGRVDVAGLNGPRSTVLSGDEEAVVEVGKKLEAQGRKATRLMVSHAFHSPHMEGMLEEFRSVVQGLRFSAGSIPLVSNVTGRRASAEELSSPDYWVMHVRQAVRFLEGVRTLEAEGVTSFLEVGPHGVLCGLAADCLSEEAQRGAVLLPSLRKGSAEVEALTAAVGGLHARGVALDWQRYFAPLGARRVALPTYVFQRERYWLENTSAHRAEAAEGSSSATDAGFWEAVDRSDVDALAQTLRVEDKDQQASLASLLPALSTWRRKQKDQGTVDAWRYRVLWKPASLGPKGDVSGTWLLVVSTAADLVAPLTEALTAAGATVVVCAVSAAETDRARLAAQLRQALGEGVAARGVLSLLALDETPLPEQPALQSGVTLSLVQALGDAGIEAPLWLLTRGAVSVTSAEPLTHPLQALLWGLGRVVSLEHPERFGGLLDLPPTLDSMARERLVSALGNQASEDQLALRSTGLFARRLVRAPLGDAASVRAWRPSGTALITGGTGALGAHVARWLARRGAEHLVLISRRGPEAPGAADLAAELTTLGARVTIAACDAADRDALSKVLELIPEDAPLTAVFHTAGVLDDGVLGALTPERMERAFSPKVDATLNLHVLTRALDLSAFVLFSSLAGVLGNAGQGNYAAANAFLDALADHRRALGLAATSVAWGAWADGGMVDRTVVGRLRGGGVSAMPPELALTALEQALGRDESALVVSDMDWARFAPSFAAGRPRPLLDELPEAQQALAGLDLLSLREREAPLMARLRALAAREQREHLLSVVKGHVAAVLGHADVASIDPDRGFSDLGLDSLMAVELRRRLQQETSASLRATVVFDQPSPRRLAGFLHDALLPRLGQDARAAVEEGSPRAASAAGDDPIAIVGVGLRLPGGAVDLESFWSVLSQGIDAAGPIPVMRWNAEEMYDPDPEAKGKSYVREASFIEGVDVFDATFFGISPREARHIDPQHRLLLEAAWQALEQAGVVPASLKDSQTGVFVGIGASEYALLQGNSGEGEAYTIMGTATSFAAGRLAFTLGLQGPALSVDTACSSSLVAMHLACQALRKRECGLALAAGVQVMLAAESFQLLSRTRAAAGDGRSKTFSANADGYGRGEGVVVVALSRLSDARAQGLPVLALVRGSAINHDGESSGITAPNGTSQQKVLRAALQDARLSPAEVDVVECHGTGTSLGDPIEVQALAAVYGQGRPADQPLLLGAVKTNIGHLESGAGLAGLAKMVAALRHEALPATLHTTPRNPYIEWDALPVRVVDTLEPWPRRPDGRPRRAGVSAFGLSGTNAHIVLEEAPALEGSAAGQENEGAPAAWDGPLALLVSGKSEAALRAQAAALSAHIEAHPEQSLSDVAWSLATTRTQFEHRAVVVARERAMVLDALGALGEGKASPSAAQGQARSAGKTVFVFPGQGSQWVGMARSLMGTSEVFRREIEACSGALGPHVDWSLAAVLRGEEGSASLERVDVVQPVLFAMMVSLAAVWRSMGVEPEAVVGHSQGEVAAAVVAGALSLEEGAKVVAVRSRLLRRLEGKGAMGAVELSAAELDPHLARYGKRVGIAAYNGPSATLVSGDAEAVEALVSELSGAQIFARKVRVSYASHSSHVDEIQEELLSALGELHPRKAVLPFYSTVEQERLSGDELSAAYWVKNLREPVRFAQTTNQLLSEQHRFFIEVSPHPVLALALQASLHASKAQGAVVGSLRNDDGTLGRLLLSVGELFARGLAVDWTKILPAGRRVELPTYAFQRQRYWLEAPKGRATDVASAGLGAANHPLLGAAVTLADADGLLLTGRLSLAEHPWLAGHRVYDTVLLPGTALVELCLAAAQHVGLGWVEELTLESPLALPPQGALQLQLSVGAPDEARRRAVTIHTRAAEAGSEAPWTRHASGWLGPSVAEARFDIASWPPAGATSLDLAGYYERLAEAGITYGKDDFQGLVAAWRQGADVLAEVCLPAGLVETAGDYGLHPALFDAALHALALLSGDEMTTSLPFVFGGVGLYATGASRLRVRLSSGDREGAIQARLADAEGRPVALIEALRTRPVSPTQLRSSVPTARDGLYRVDWTALAECSAPPLTGAWVLLGEGPRGLTAALEASSVRLSRMADLEALSAALEGGEEAPELVLVPWVGATGASPAAVHATTHRALSLLQRWVSDERLSSTRLVLLTCRAIAAGAEEDVLDLEHAPLWGLGRTAQSEYSDQPIQLVDVDASEASFGALRSALNAGEPQLALRDGGVRVPRLGRLTAGEVLVPPPGEASYHLDIPTRGSLDGLSFVASSHGSAPLASGQVRIAVRAAGLNFRDVLNALGMYPGDAGPLGLEGAGVITEVGPDVQGLLPGDRVMGMFPRSIGPLAVADARMVIRMPEGWSFAQGAATPSAFVTAYYALVELARLQPGERLLVHAAAGGVGMAAVQLARHLGAEVFGTASAGKWSVLRGQGLTDSHIGSSRTLGFEEHFGRTTQGQGVDVVLNSLAREYVDASLRLLPRGGRFIEMGKTDVREAPSIAKTHPGVRYQAFDLTELSPDHIQQMLRELVTLFERGVLQPLPVQAWDARRAPEAFRFFGQARHVGKLVLTMPRALAPEGTVLITGGTGGLGALLARHLVDTHGVRHLLLTSRQGLAAPGAGALQAELEGKGAQVTIAACDVSDREAVAHLLASVPQDHPLTAVIHGAVVLDDGVLSALDPGRVDRVFLAKVDGAMHLSELTRPLDLSSFVLFSSGAGVFGNAGQGSYAAANVFLDALAAHRRAQGLSGQSLAWGAWGEVGRAARLAEADQARLRRQGVLPLSPQEGLALFDAALGRPEALLAPLRLDFGALRAQASAPRLLHALVRTSPRRAAAHGRGAASSLKQRLAALPATERDKTLLEFVRNQVAPVLGLSHPEALDPARPLQELGLDSLMAVELRNRLGAATDLRLPSTLLFDHPTASALVRILRTKLAVDAPAESPTVFGELNKLESLLLHGDHDERTRQAAAARLQALLAKLTVKAPADTSLAQQIDSADDDQLFALIDQDLDAQGIAYE
ncbi:SDR family NAD(P)-dependent oxidoreductase [Sorangium sp. So ce131]